MKITSDLRSANQNSHPTDLAGEDSLNLDASNPSGEQVNFNLVVITEPARAKSVQIGRSRPPLEIEDLPTPEEVFKVKHIGMEELIMLVLGPGLIAVGVSLGSGAWLYSPLNISLHGFKGLFWVVLVSTALQVFYNVELARFTIATGESPILAFGRNPPGYFLWIPLALICLYMALIMGSWTVNAGSSLFALIAGRQNTTEELEIVRWVGVGLLFLVFFITLIGRKIERTMEAIQGIFLPFILVGLILVTLVVVPLDFWGQALTSLFIPSRPPVETGVSVLGTLAGFSALASGLNFMFIGYYRDKGYGMGHKTGYIASWFSKPQNVLSPAGKTFSEDDQNRALWKRWFRYLLLDQWGIYFVGTLVGIVVPCILVGYLASISGDGAPDQASMLTFASIQLGQRYGPLLAGWALLVGFMILFSTQIGILELLVRNMTDAVYGVSHRLRQWVRNDPRKFYYTFMLFLILVIGILIHQTLPGRWAEFSANFYNFAAMIFPLVTIYLNRQLPRPARITWWSYLVLLANVIFFGFFFINFLYLLLTGTPLMRI
jgi:hypothetical protein